MDPDILWVTLAPVGPSQWVVRQEKSDADVEKKEVLGRLDDTTQDAINEWCQAFIHRAELSHLGSEAILYTRSSPLGAPTQSWSGVDRIRATSKQQVQALIECEATTDSRELATFVRTILCTLVVEACRVMRGAMGPGIFVERILRTRAKEGSLPPLDLNSPLDETRVRGSRSATWYAARRTDHDGYELLRTLQEFGAAIQSFEGHDRVTNTTLIGAAAQGGNLQSLQWLIQNNACWEPTSEGAGQHRTPMSTPRDVHHPVALLDQALYLREHKTPLMAGMCYKVLAAWRGVVLDQVSYSSLPPDGDSGKTTAFLRAIVLDMNPEAALDALQNGGTARGVTDLGWTPLHYAASLAEEKQRHELCKLLVEQLGEEQVTAADNDNWTPLTWAVAHNDPTLLELLLKYISSDSAAQDTPPWAILPIFESIEKERRVVFPLPHPMLHRVWDLPVRYNPNEVSSLPDLHRTPSLRDPRLSTPAIEATVDSIRERAGSRDLVMLRVCEQHVEAREYSNGVAVPTILRRLQKDGVEELDGEAIFGASMEPVKVVVRYHRRTGHIEVYRKEEFANAPDASCNLVAFLDGKKMQKKWLGGRSVPHNDNAKEFDGYLDTMNRVVRASNAERVQIAERGRKVHPSEYLQYDTLLHVAVRHGFVKVASILMNTVPSLVREINWAGGPPLLTAVLSAYMSEEDRNEMVRKMERMGRDTLRVIIGNDAAAVKADHLAPLLPADRMWYRVLCEDRVAELKNAVFLQSAGSSALEELQPTLLHAVRYACAVGDCEFLRTFGNEEMRYNKDWNISRLLEVACTFASTGRDIEAVRVISENLHPPLTENALYTAMEYAPHYDMARYLLRSQTTPVELTALPLTTANRWNGGRYVDEGLGRVCIPELQFAMTHNLVGDGFLYRLLDKGAEWKWHEDHAAFGLSALVAIDLQNDFFEESLVKHHGPQGVELVTCRGARAVPGAERIVPLISKLWRDLRCQMFNMCIVSQDLRKRDHPSFAKAHAMHPGSSVWDGYRNQDLRVEYCVMDNNEYTLGSRFRNDVEIDIEDVRVQVVRKGDTPHLDTNMAFFQRLTTCLESHGIRHVYLCGPTLDDTVGKTALHCLRKGYLTTVITDLTDGYSKKDKDAIALSILENGGEFMESTSLMGCEKVGFKGPPVHMWREILYSPALHRLLKRPPAGLMDLLLNDFNFVLSPKLPEVFLRLVSVVEKIGASVLPAGRGFTVAGVHISRQYFSYLKYPLHFLLFAMCGPVEKKGGLCRLVGVGEGATASAKRLLHRVIDFINHTVSSENDPYAKLASKALPVHELEGWVKSVPKEDTRRRLGEVVRRLLTFHFTGEIPAKADLSPLELAVSLVVVQCGLPLSTVKHIIQKWKGLIRFPWGETGCTKGGREYCMDTFYDIWQPNRHPAVAVASSAVVWQQERPVPLLHKVLRYIRDNYSSASECPSQSPALFDETRNMYTTLPLPRAYKQSVVVGMEAGESPSCKHLIDLVKILIQWPAVERRIRVRHLLPSSKTGLESGELVTFIVSKDRHTGEIVKGKFFDRFGLFERSWREGSLLGDTGVSLILQAAPSQAETILHPDILNDSGYGSVEMLQTLVIHTDASVQIKHRHLFKATQGGHEVLAYDRHLGVLHWACLLGNVRLLQLLVEGVNVEVLRSSCPVGDEDIVTRIPGTDLYCPTTELGYTPLHYAAYSGSPACLSYLMQNAAATASPSDVGRFINHQAMHLITPANRDMELTLSDIEWVGRVVRNGDTECYIPCCKVSTDGDTALHVAAQFCHVQASETLINAGASLVIRNTKETLDPHDITLAVHTKLILQKEEKYRERAACWCLGICTEPTTGSPTHSQVNRKVSKPSKMMPDEETDDVEQCSIASSAQGDECKPDADDKDEHEDEEEHMRLLHGVFNQREEASAKLYGFAWKYFLTSNPLAYMIFLICFTAAVFLLYQPNGWWTTNAVYDALSTSEYDIPSELQFRADMNHISDIEELALWLKGPFYRNFFENASDYPNVLLGAYHLVGAIRLSVLRSSSTCDNNLAGSLARHVQCYEAWGEHNNNKSGHFGFVWDRWTSSIRTHSFRSQLTGNSWPVHEGLTHLISINNASRRDAILGEGGVVDQGGIDHAVRFLRLAMPLYNTHTHRFLLFELMWEIPPEGNLYPTYRASIFRLSNYDDAVDYVRLVLEVVVLCFMVWFTVEELIDLYYTIRRVIKAQERFSIKERQKLQEVDTTLPRSRFLSNISGDEAADSGGNGEEHDARDMDPLKKTIAERKEEKQKLVTMHQRKGRFRFVRRLTECFSTLMEHRGEWNMLDAAVLILLWSCFATHIIIFCEQAEYTESVVLSPQTAHDDRVVNFEELAHMVTWEQLILSYVMLLSWLKFLKYLTYVPVLGPVVLAIVTTVLSQEVKIFLVVYLVVMASLVLSMAVLLSTINADLANWMGSWFTTLRMMLGDWDFDAMRDSHWLLGPFLFAFAVLFGHLILLNVFIGLVSQVYETQLEEARERWNAKISALYVHKSRQLSLPDVDKLNGSLEFITSCNRRDCYQWRKDPEKWRWDVIDKSIINRYHTATIRTEDIPPLTMGSVRPKESEMQPCNRDRDELPFMQSGPSFRRHPAFAEDLLEQSVSMNEPSS